MPTNMTIKEAVNCLRLMPESVRISSSDEYFLLLEQVSLLQQTLLAMGGAQVQLRGQLYDLAKGQPSTR